jgi:CRISPR/Cas system-associated exonuclease Cas4 (RecB family)
VALHPPDDASARAQPLAGMPGPRWNRNKGIYPTSLRRYLECPRRCRLEYIDRIRYERPWERAMEVGNALHKVMERVGNTLQRRQAPPPTETFRSLVETLLPEREYDDPQVRAADIDDILLWAAVGEAYINDGEAQVLIVEHYDPLRWEDRGELGSVMLGAKADIVVRRHDAEGPYLEIIDYKTGRNRDHTEFTPLLSRIALKRRIDAALRGQAEPRVVFTYLWLRAGEVDRRWQTREEMHHRWDDLRSILVRMVHEEEWPMRPNPRVCRFCPYLDTVCFPHHSPADPAGIDGNEMARQ